MRVELISITKPEFPEMADDSAEDLIVYCARVSNPKSQEAGDNAAKLIRYLVTHKHWSPFEMVDMTVEIMTSRAVAAQILRHRSFSFQEFSQRYASANTLGFEMHHARRQDDKNRQSSIDDLPDETKKWFYDVQTETHAFANEMYSEALKRGIAREQARYLLPLSTTTRMYMKGSVRSWIHYLAARLDPSTQKEHRLVAAEIAAIFRAQFPTVSEALGIITP
jgi:thymidylate synthase (FAD)